ncbi:MAG: orotidine-5'-phosphate decarboxylase [Candidatus Omnitrophota bacterium]
MSGNMSAELIVALDVPDLARAERLVRSLRPLVRVFKIGSRLFTTEGPQAVRRVRSLGAEVFLDLKFHDIPNTVSQSVAAAADLGVFMLTVHAQGGKAMLDAARLAARRARRPPKIVAVTLLTSQQAAASVSKRIMALAEEAFESKLEGVVASAQECQALRRKFGKGFIIVTPGIRPQSAEKGDQKRVATAGQAVRAGSSYLVVGRPVIEAADPRQAVEDILAEMTISGMQ